MTVTEPSAPSARRVILAVGGITLERVADWMPRCPDQQSLQLPGQDPLPILPEACPVPPAPTSTPRTLPRPAGARLAGSAAAIILECLSGRRALPHLRMMCTERAYERLHDWPRGPGWARAAIMSSPHVDGDDGAVEAVVLIEIEGRTVAMALSLRRHADGWLVDDAQLAVSQGVNALLGGDPLSSPSRGSA